MFSCQFYEIVKNIFFTERLRTFEKLILAFKGNSYLDSSLLLFDGFWEGGWGPTISHGIFGTNSGFRACEGAHCGKGLIAIFRDFFASVSEIFISAGHGGGWALGCSSMDSMEFGHFPNISYFLVSLDLKPYVARQLVSQLVYTMFLSNNRASFDLW